MAEKEKSITKNIKFNYFVGYLTIDKEVYKENERKYTALEKIHEKVTGKKKLTPIQKSILADEIAIREKKNIYDKYGRSKWLATEMFQTILDETISTAIKIDDMPIEIEPGSLKINDITGITTFQLSKMRADLLPAKKKIDKHKEDIKLASDEYIGEFTSILFDEKQSVFMVQSNMYGLTHSQVEQYLTILRRKVIKETASEDMLELACELSVIIDSCDIQNIKGSQEVKKIRFRAADGIYEALAADKDNYFAKVRRSLGQKTGYVIDITVSIDRDTEIATLDGEIMNDVVDNFELIKKSQYDPNLLVEITRKEDENSNTELINLLHPKMTDVISVKMKPRTSVSHESLSLSMQTSYENAKGKIYKILGA